MHNIYIYIYREREREREDRERWREINETETTRTYLKVSIRSSNSNGGVVTHNLRAYHRDSFTLCGVNLTRHDRRTGLVLRERELTKTTTRTGAKEANIVSDLHDRDSQSVEGTRALNNGIMGSKGLELKKREKE